MEILQIPVHVFIVFLLFCLIGVPETSQASTVDNSTTILLPSVLKDDPASSVGMFEVPFFLVVLIVALVLLTVSCVSWPIVCSQCLFLKHMRHLDVEPLNVPMAQSIV